MPSLSNKNGLQVALKKPIAVLKRGSINQAEPSSIRVIAVVRTVLEPYIHGMLTFKAPLHLLSDT